MTSNFSSVVILMLGVLIACGVQGGSGAQAGEGAEAPAVRDSFQDVPRRRWSSTEGKWKATEEQVEVYDVDEGVLFTSPEEPSHVAFVGLWKEEDGAVKASFEHMYGNPGLAPSYRPHYGRWVLYNQGKSEEEWLAFTRAHRMFETEEEALSATPEQAWSAFCKAHNMSEGPEDAIATTTEEFPILVTRDGGDTWQNLGPNPNREEGCRRYFVYNRQGKVLMPGRAPVRCRDGRIVSTVKSGQQKKGCLLGIKESLDDGKTWLPTQSLLPEGSDEEIISAVSGETAMVELDDGRLLVVIRPRSPKLGRPCQTYLTRIGPGQYTATPPTWTPFPYSGQPYLRRGEDGVIWYWGHDGHWYTLDDGQTWHPIPQRMGSYYGQMVYIGSQRLLCATHTIGDSPYPHWNDAAIKQYRFSYRRSATMEQTDAGAARAAYVRREADFTDLHLRADVRFEGANGLAFRIQPEANSYYVFAVVSPDEEVYAPWLPSPEQQEVLSAHYIVAEWALPHGEPMVILARVDNGELEVLRGMRLRSKLEKGTWIQMQVKVTGDLLQGAVNAGSRPIYVGARDATYKSGQVGLFTDQSTGAFKHFCAWSRPQMIRDLWR